MTLYVTEPVPGIAWQSGEPKVNHELRHVAVVRSVAAGFGRLRFLLAVIVNQRTAQREQSCPPPEHFQLTWQHFVTESRISNNEKISNNDASRAALLGCNQLIFSGRVQNYWNPSFYLTTEKVFGFFSKCLWKFRGGVNCPVADLLQRHVDTYAP